jgi:hypothetical protein
VTDSAFVSVTLNVTCPLELVWQGEALQVMVEWVPVFPFRAITFPLTGLLFASLTVTVTVELDVPLAVTDVGLAVTVAPAAVIGTREMFSFARTPPLEIGNVTVPELKPGAVAVSVIDVEFPVNVRWLPPLNEYSPTGGPGVVVVLKFALQPLVVEQLTVAPTIPAVVLLLDTTPLTEAFPSANCVSACEPDAEPDAVRMKLMSMSCESGENWLLEMLPFESATAVKSE